MTVLFLSAISMWFIFAIISAIFDDIPKDFATFKRQAAHRQEQDIYSQRVYDAEHGDASAQYNFGVMYARGEGVPKDDVEAVTWVRKAAEQGLTEAQSTLGVMYAQSTGVPKDYATAYMWVNLAAARHDKAKKYLDVLEREATADQVAEGQKMAREWTATHSLVQQP